MPDDLDLLNAKLDALNAKLQDFVVRYEQRHADLQMRVVTLETLTRSFATREDIIKLTQTLESFQRVLEATASQFETASSAMATKTDTDWLKRSYWWGLGIVAAILSAIAIALVSHLIKP